MGNEMGESIIVKLQEDIRTAIRTAVRSLVLRLTEEMPQRAAVAGREQRTGRQDEGRF